VNHKPILQPLWSYPSSNLVSPSVLPNETPLELNFYELIKNYLSQLLVLIILVDCFRNNFGLGFLAVFLSLLALILVALLVNLETVHDVGKEIKKFSVFVGYLAHSLAGLSV